MPGDPSFRDRAVLVGEDSALITYELAAAVAALGCAVIGPAATVAEARRLLDGGLPDAVLLDVHLDPGTAAQIAEMLRAAGVPYAAVTGYDGRDLEDPVWQGVPHLIKPFRKQQVQTLVRGLPPAAG